MKNEEIKKSKFNIIIATVIAILVIVFSLTYIYSVLHTHLQSWNPLFFN